MNTLPAICAAILAGIAVDFGDFDLSVADKVKEGTFTIPPTLPFASLTPPALTDSEPQAKDAWYLETYEAELRLWAPVTTSHDRVERGRRFAAEVVQALDSVRATVGSALWRCVFWRVSRSDPEAGAATALPGAAHAVVTITFTFRREAGTGV